MKLGKDFDGSLLQKGLHLFILFSVAVAYPSFQLLSGSATFFIAGKYEPVDLVFLTAALCIVIPGGLLLLEYALGHRRIAGRFAHALFISVLVAAIVLPVLKKYLSWPGASLLLIAIGAGTSVTTLSFRYAAARSAVTLLSPLVLVIPGLFLLDDRISKIIWRNEGTPVPLRFTANNPLVVLILDELPLKSLLDEQGSIDQIRFPHFAEFGRNSTWYRNATTVSDNTIFAVPAILTGKYPNPQLLPIRMDHPHNMFTVFESAYEVHAFENSSKFWNERKNKPNDSFPKRNSGLLADLSAVYLHYLLPRSFAKALPSIDHTWGNFWQMMGVKQINRFRSDDHRTKMFRKFIRSVHRSGKPGFYFMHSMLPHVPWQHFPSGKQYNGKGIGNFGIDGCKSETWLKDSHIVDFALNRHLMQVEYVDQLFGEFIHKMKQEKLFDRALIVVVSDHGACFHPGHQRRHLDADHHEDVLRVPLWIKRPHQASGLVDEGNAQTIDVFPTILDILDIEARWKLDGRSLLDGAPDLPTKIAFSKGKRFEYPFRQYQESAFFQSVRRAPAEPGVGQVDKNLADLKDAGVSPVEIHLHNSNAFEHVQTQSKFVPALITAHADSRAFPADGRFGIVVNGVMRSVVQPFQFGDGRAYLSGLVPESSFRTGVNHVEIVILQNDGNEFLRPKMIPEKGQPSVE